MQFELWLIDRLFPSHLPSLISLSAKICWRLLDNRWWFDDSDSDTVTLTSIAKSVGSLDSRFLLAIPGSNIMQSPISSLSWSPRKVSWSDAYVYFWINLSFNLTFISLSPCLWDCDFLRWTAAEFGSRSSAPFRLSDRNPKKFSSILRAKKSDVIWLCCSFYRKTFMRLSCFRPNDHH